MDIRTTCLVFSMVILPLFLGCATSTPAQRLAQQTVQARAVDQQVLIYQIQTKFLDNISPQGAYTRVRFVNTSNRPLVAIAFEAVPYAYGEPILQTVSAPVVFGAKGNFEPGKRYTVLSAKPVWSGPWTRVDCVQLVGVALQYADGQTERIDRGQITNYLTSEIAPQNCSNPNTNPYIVFAN